jgi:hypothetical protein
MEYIVTDLLKALLGNGSASTFQHAPRNNTVEVFCVRAWTIAIQHIRGDVTQQCVGIT